MKTETNGYLFHGYKDGLFYKNGLLANGVCDDRSESELAFSTPRLGNPPNYFINGVLSYRMVSAVLYKVDGLLETLFTGELDNVVYVDGKRHTGYYHEKLYHDGRSVTYECDSYIVYDDYEQAVQDTEFLDKYFPKKIKVSLVNRIKNKFKKDKPIDGVSKYQRKRS